MYTEHSIRFEVLISQSQIDNQGLLNILENRMSQETKRNKQGKKKNLVEIKTMEEKNEIKKTIIEREQKILHQ